jgi:LSD1 subclass zinc finger protein
MWPNRELCTMTRYAYLEIARTCGGCGRPLPINGPVTRVRCASCFTVNPVPVTTLAQAFDITLDGDVTLEAPGATRSQTPLAAGGIYRLTWGRHAPVCPSCRQTLPEAAPDAGDVTCPSCGEACATFAPPPWLARLYPSAMQLYLAAREEIADGDAPALQMPRQGERPVVMACDQCGGGLSITHETPQLHTCPFCQATIWIPEDLWERLHPVEAVRGWFVRFDGTRGRGANQAVSEELDKRYDVETLALDQRQTSTPIEQKGPSRWACLRFHSTCDACKEPIPINGPLPHVVCPSCRADKPLEPDVVGDQLAWVGEDRAVFDGLVVRSSGRFQLKATRVPPFCHVCENALPWVEVGTDTVIRCEHCGTKHATFPVPPSLAEHAGIAKQLYCAQRDPLAHSGEASGESSAYDCPACGAALSVTSETERIAPCSFCSEDVFLPDEVWLRIHPVAHVRPWFVDTGFEPKKKTKKDPAQKALAQAEKAERKARAQAEKVQKILVGTAVGLGLALLIGWVAC